MDGHDFYDGLRIGLGGYNPGSQNGTGVATYARNLSFRIHDLGAKVDVIQDIPVLKSKNPFLAEVGYFNFAGEKDANGSLPPLGRRLFTSFVGRSAFEVPVTGKVILRAFEAELPYHDRLLNSPRLLAEARQHFRFYRRFLTLRLKEAPAIMHWSYPVPVRLAGAKNIYTVHDIVPLRLPYTTLDNKKYYYRLIKGCQANGDLISTVSEHSKQDLVDLLGANPERVVNTYQSVGLPPSGTDKSEEQVAAELKDIFGVDYKRFFLFFGAIEPKKNVGRLVEAFLSSRAEDPLVLVGPTAWKSGPEVRLLNEYKRRQRSRGSSNVDSEDRIRRFGYVSRSLLVSLIRGAKAVLFPSLYEGFGLPLLEAMQLGTPVMTSTEASLPEIGGTAALYVDPYQIGAMARQIEALDRDEALRDDLTARGRVQAAKFSHEAYAARLDGMYREVLGAPASSR